MLAVPAATLQAERVVDIVLVAFSSSLMFNLLKKKKYIPETKHLKRICSLYNQYF